MAVKPTIEYLRALPLFEGLEDDQLQSIQTISVIKKYPQGAILYYERDKNSEIYYLVNGLLKVYKVDGFDNEIFMYNLYEHMLISEITDFDRIGCFANTEFAMDSEVLVLEFEGFQTIYQTSQALLLQLMQEFARKSKMMQCIINREIVFDATAKVSFMLINDLKSFNRLKKQEVASMLNIQPETLSRILKKLTRNGVIASENQDVIILDENALRESFE